MFEFLSQAFFIILYQPLLNILILIYEYLPIRDFGIAIIIFTVIIKILLHPLGRQAIKSQKILSELQPKIEEAQKKFKDDKEKQMKVMLEIYKREKINPFASFLPLLIQLPLLIALYRLFWKGLGPEQLSHMYSFIPHPGSINTVFLGTIDLAQSSALKIIENGAEHFIPLWPNIILAVLVGLAQFFQTKMIISKKRQTKKPLDFSRMMEKQMLIFFPIFTVIILLKLPAALALYWLISMAFTIGEQYAIFKKIRERV